MKEFKFINRIEFRNWLELNAKTHDGIWIIFERGKTLSANDALEEALCFGWIDGLMKNINQTTYKKYFASRRSKSKWSEKNKRIALTLINDSLMTDLGYQAIEEAKQNGMWEGDQKKTISDDEKAYFLHLLNSNELALVNFSKMSPSIQKNYILFYYDAKTDETKQKRIIKIIDRLEKNLKPM